MGRYLIEDCTVFKSSSRKSIENMKLGTLLKMADALDIPIGDLIEKLLYMKNLPLLKNRGFFKHFSFNLIVIALVANCIF